MSPIEIHKGYLADDKKMITAYIKTEISTGDLEYGNQVL